MEIFFRKSKDNSPFDISGIYCWICGRCHVPNRWHGCWWCKNEQPLDDLGIGICLLDCDWYGKGTTQGCQKEREILICLYQHKVCFFLEKLLKKHPRRRVRTWARMFSSEHECILITCRYMRTNPQNYECRKSPNRRLADVRRLPPHGRR